MPQLVVHEVLCFSVYSGGCYSFQSGFVRLLFLFSKTCLEAVNNTLMMLENGRVCGGKPSQSEP